jgi:hypothetical protein
VIRATGPGEQGAGGLLLRQTLTVTAADRDFAATRAAYRAVVNRPAGSYVFASGLSALGPAPRCAATRPAPGSAGGRLPDRRW